MTVISMGEDKLNGIDIDTDGHTARRHAAPLAIDAEPNSVPAAGWPAGRGTPYPAHVLARYVDQVRLCIQRRVGGFSREIGCQGPYRGPNTATTSMTTCVCG